ncbi:MAG: hypothetical protein DCF15_13765 [Phormidesmis priestleyi]|uniref:Uncharacterized protein n=1 Tax=Phormidesmis priestleyi TaxID=268141 RepID=A0A2W4X5M9_9CYAN|nr:MAG: hypothetical protein DCF15_13765 [Phormidesmis priestleyi]
MPELSSASRQTVGFAVMFYNIAELDHSLQHDYFTIYSICKFLYALKEEPPKSEDLSGVWCEE